MNFLVRVIVNALALLVISYFQIAGIHVSGIFPALVGALVLGVVNAVIRPILLLLSLPLLILTLGLFTLVINGFIFYVVLKFVPGFFVPGFWAAFWGAIAMSIISWLASLLVREVEQPRAA